MLSFKALTSVAAKSVLNLAVSRTVQRSLHLSARLNADNSDQDQRDSNVLQSEKSECLHK